MWNENPTILTISIIPPWYNTLGFNIFGVILFLLSGILFYKFRTTKLIKDTLKLEELPIKKDSSFSEVSLKELHKRLNDAVTEEKYELAAKIRDEISKRS